MKYQISQEGVIYSINEDNTITRYGRVLPDGTLEQADGRPAPRSNRLPARRVAPAKDRRLRNWLYACVVLLAAVSAALWFCARSNMELRASVGELDGAAGQAAATIRLQRDTIVNLTQQLEGANSQRARAEQQARQFAEAVRPVMPILVTGVKLHNVGPQNQALSDYGQPLRASSLLYLQPMLTYTGLESGNCQLEVRIVMPNGMVRGGNGSGYSYSTARLVYEGPDRQLVLPGFGSGMAGTWMPGTYALEIYYNGSRIFRTNFNVIDA